MNISLNWLTDYVSVQMPAEELAELFTRIGFICEEITETDTDIVLDLEITSNRPDMLGHLGVARELAAAGGLKFTPLQVPELPTEGKVSELTSVEVRDPDLCPRYTARVLQGVKVGPSPQWMVERLEAVGLRSVNNVVDVTNYVLMEYSQPLHSFDYDKLAGNRIVVRRAKGGEMLVSIDETKCHLDEEMLIIADADRAVAVAGIMGGRDTEVSEGTTNILLEAAQFDPLVTRKTSRKLGLMSESNYRFERGVDPVLLDEASLRACQLIVQLAGGTVAEGVVDVWATPYEAPTVPLRPERCDKLLGMAVAPERQKAILASLGLEPVERDDKLLCTIPPHRADLRREADLIEEVARIVGYDQIPVGGEVTHEVRPEELPQRLRRRAGRMLTAAGFDEAISFNFVDDDEAALVGVPEPVRVDAKVRKTHNTLRPSLLPNLLRACRTNQSAGNMDVSLYELAAVFPPPADDEQRVVDERTSLALVTTGELRDLRGAVEALVGDLAPGTAMAILPADAPGLAEGMAAKVLLGGVEVGSLGLISEKVQHHYGLEQTIAAATLDFTLLGAQAQLERKYQALPKFPPVQRDLSLIVADDVPWSRLEEVIASVRQPMREHVEYVTTYRGKPIPKGAKSVTVTLTYRSPEGTLKREQVDQQVDQIVAAAKKALEAEVRQ